uniref:Dysbindin domain containing 2 n=2 Tax=Theropithecus gelada TaxID=9565 RepID=A0A8D2FWA5_THEGE
MRAGNFLTALEVPVVALAGAASGRGASCKRVRPPPPLPHFRLPPLPRSRLPGPVSRLEPGAPLLGRWQWGSPSPGPPCLVFRLCSCTCFAPLPPGADMDPNPRAALERQQLRLRERQKFFEDILQPETEFVFPLSHLHLESQRPPIGSISSMEVNVDTLEQVELIDLGDPDGADVFLPCEDPPPTPQSSGVDNHLEELSLPVPTSDRTTSRTSSSSSDSSTNLHSPNPSDDGADTPLAQSDEEEERSDGGAEPGACS